MRKCHRINGNRFEKVSGKHTAKSECWILFSLTHISGVSFFDRNYCNNLLKQNTHEKKKENDDRPREKSRRKIPNREMEKTHSDATNESKKRDKNSTITTTTTSTREHQQQDKEEHQQM